MATSFASVGSVLKRVAHRLGLESKLFEFHLRRHWGDAVGEQIAAHTRPDQIRFKKLYVIAQNSIWVQQLTFLKPTLIENVNAAANSELISDIVLRVGDVDEGTSKRGKGKSDEGFPEEPVPLPEVLEQAAAHTQQVKDPDLRARLRNVIARALSLPESQTKSGRRHPGNASPPASRSPTSGAP